ncbi:MAG: type II toxin-antitoxin system VapC family toxin [Candidatus Saccharimonadales bacterium]
MVLLDTNIFIYLANGTLGSDIIADLDIAHASITRVEALGFSEIPAGELILLEALFSESYELPLVDSTIQQAIRLRQAKKMSLGDALVAATAIENELELWTANIDDYSHIDDLKLHNPL